jgi:hypothetical protein
MGTKSGIKPREAASQAIPSAHGTVKERLTDAIAHLDERIDWDALAEETEREWSKTLKSLGL